MEEEIREEEEVRLNAVTGKPLPRRRKTSEERALAAARRERAKSRAKKRGDAMRRLGIRPDRRINLSQDILWVYENSEAGESERENLEAAPGLGALALLGWVNESDSNRKIFYQTMLPKALAIEEAKEKAVKEANKAEIEEDLTLVEVERLLKGFVKTKGVAGSF